MFCDVGMTRKAISDNLVSCWLFYKESHRIFRGKQTVQVTRGFLGEKQIRHRKKEEM